eukprot:14874196-Alexandrium_andersonii.AAC.1
MSGWSCQLAESWAERVALPWRGGRNGGWSGVMCGGHSQQRGIGSGGECGAVQSVGWGDSTIDGSSPIRPWASSPVPKLDL